MNKARNILLKEQDYYIDIATRNKTFLQTWKNIREMGVKNCRFFLKIYNPNLIGVNPYDARLTDVQKAEILQEVMMNPWYLLREIIRFPAPGGGDPFQLSIGNLAEVWCVLNNLNFYIEMPRQTGKTYSLVAIYLWIYEYRTSYTNMIFGNKDFGGSKENLNRYKKLRELLPEYLIMKDKGDKDNAESISSSKNHNYITLMPSPNNAESANNAGRGLTSAILWWDEWIPLMLLTRVTYFDTL